MNNTIERVLSVNPSPEIEELPKPEYKDTDKSIRKIMLAAEIMRKHTANAGWQLTKGLESVRYELWGYNFERHYTDVNRILKVVDPSICVVQDQREWDGKTASYKNPRIKFHNVETLRDREDIFKLTVLKDCQQKPQYHKNSADSMGAHAWITYYHPRIVKHLAPYVREKNLIRTYHSVNRSQVPEFSTERQSRAILSGALSMAYPLRCAIKKQRGSLPKIDWLPHPGYGTKGCKTPEYLRKLSQYKVAICTSSRYGYSLRKIIEATACGCAVLTDLPEDDTLPKINGNLYRVSPSYNKSEIADTLNSLYQTWNPELQSHFSQEAIGYYNYLQSAIRLSADINRMQESYNNDAN